MWGTRRVVAVLLVFGAFAAPALATYYVSARNGNWGTPATWSPQGIPGQSDSVYIIHSCSLETNHSVYDITIAGAGQFVADGAWTLQVYGNWTNNGTAALSNGYVFFSGGDNATIGGTAPTTFYRARVNKADSTVAVMLQQDVTFAYGGTGALVISPGALVTNGFDLTATATNARVDVGSSGQTSGARLYITDTSVVSVYHLYQNVSNATNNSKVVVSGTPTLNIGYRHTVWNSGARFDVSGGTVNYLSTGSTYNIYLATNNPGWGWFATGGTITFNGSITSVNYNTHFRASDSAVVVFAGSQNSIVNLHSWSLSGFPLRMSWWFNDLRVEKTGGTGLAVGHAGSEPVDSMIRIPVGVTVNNGGSLTLNGSFAADRGYDAGTVVVNGTLAQNAPRIYVAGDWYGGGSFAHGDQRVIFGGATSAQLDGTPGPFWDVLVAKPGAALDAVAGLGVADSLVLSDGTFRLHDTLVLGHAAEGGSDQGMGTVHVTGDDGTDGGGFFADSMSAVVAADPSYPYAFTVDGTIGALGTYFSGMDSSGIHVTSSGTIDAALDFSYCTFDHGTLGGAMLKLENAQDLDTLFDVSFSGTAGWNVEKLADAGSVTFAGEFGTRWGEDFDNDPYDRVDWIKPGGDVGVIAIIEPSIFVDTNATVTPTATWHNYGVAEADFRAWVRITSPTLGLFYDEEILVLGLGAGMDTVLAFSSFNVGLDTGSWSMRCSTYAAGDTVPGNDVMVRVFVVRSRWTGTLGWSEVTSMPGPTPVKRGGWLAANTGNGIVYGGKGNKTWEFYAYDPTGDSWFARAPMPTGAKYPDKGACGDADGENKVYALKGSNTSEFYRYEISQDSWHRLPDVPEGPSGKKVKGGTDVEFVPGDETGFLYTLKGYRCEFYKYDSLGQQWIQLPDAPSGLKPKWDKGSWICYDDESTIYALKAKYYDRVNYVHEFWRYDVRGDTWYSGQLAGMPLFGLHGGRIKKKKAKDGGAADHYDGAIYALKGGNTQQFWKYLIAQDTWVEWDTIPTLGSTMKKKRVKYGADFVHWGGGAFFALKGNKTNEFWRYVLPAALAAGPGRSGIMGEVVAAGRPGFTLAPNPLAGGQATLRYVLPAAGPATVRVFDVAGRSVLRRSLVATRSGAVVLDARHLAAGVYLVRLDAGGFTAARKLVVRR